MNRILVACGALVLGALAGGVVYEFLQPKPTPGWSAPRPCVDDPLLSIGVIGDSGRPYRLTSPLVGALVVGKVLAREDARRAFDALLFLGDNFYSHGLRAETLEHQIRQNLVRPYCRFMDGSGVLWPRVADACPLPPEERRPIPITAVLGNHDYRIPESPTLQREVLPRYVSNWNVPAGIADVVELAGGVSLVLIDSEQVVKKMVVGGAGPAPLVEALRRSRGPWRIVATHRPIATVPQERWSKVLLAAFEEADVDLHLFLSGHEHALLVLTMPPPAPPLHLVSGGGSRTREFAEWGQLFGAESLGFLRVDLARVAGEERLVAAMHTTSSIRGGLGGEAERHGCWQVNRAGRVATSRNGAP